MKCFFFARLGETLCASVIIYTGLITRRCFSLSLFLSSSASVFSHYKRIVTYLYEPHAHTIIKKKCITICFGEKQAQIPPRRGRTPRTYSSAKLGLRRRWRDRDRRRVSNMYTRNNAIVLPDARDSDDNPNQDNNNIASNRAARMLCDMRPRRASDSRPKQITNCRAPATCIPIAENI